MSMRWSLFRFLRSTTLYDTSQERGSGIPHSLQPQVDPKQTQARSDKLEALQVFSAAVNDAVCTSHLDGFYAFGQEGGFLKLVDVGDAFEERPVDLKWRKPVRFLAYDKAIRDVKMCWEGRRDPRPLIVTVGEDSKGCSVKVWTTKRVGEGENLRMTSLLRLPTLSKPAILAIASVDEKLRKVAVGGANGTVTLFMGDVEKERVARYIVERRYSKDDDHHKILLLKYSNSTLYCITQNSVEAIVARGGRENELLFERVLLDSQGCSLGPSSASVVKFSDEVVIAREEALYFYNSEGRGPCLAFPSGSADVMLEGFGPYLLHATQNAPKSVIIYDLLNRVIAYRGKLDLMKAFEVNTNGSGRAVLLVERSGSVTKLEELPLNARVNMLLERRMYQQAVSLAKRDPHQNNTDVPSALLVHALKCHADDLIDHGNYDAAAEQLVQTLHGDLEPSSVILQLIEQPGIRSGLRRYLEALHSADLASLFHARVLITCYRRDRARALILDAERSRSDRDVGWKGLERVLCRAAHTTSDIDEIIEACREAGLYNLAVSVARSRSRYAVLTKILIDDLENTEAAFDLLKHIPFDKALEVIRGVGHKMLKRAPNEFTDLVRNLLLDKVRSNGELTELSWLSQLFSDASALLVSILEDVVEGLPTKDLSLASTATRKLWTFLFESAILYDLKRGRTPGVEERKAEGEKEGSKALEILKSPKACLDKHDALGLSEIYCHSECIEYLYISMHLFRELGLHLRLKKDSKGLLDACRVYGHRDPQLWVEGLRHFISLASTDEWVKQEGNTERLAFEECVRELDSSGGMQPMEIVDLVVETNPTAPWDVLKSYLTSTLTLLDDERISLESRARVLSQDISGMREEIAKLSEHKLVMKRSVCSACGTKLDLPCVHFYCGHSYHVGCNSKPDQLPSKVGKENEMKDECPQCVDGYEQMRLEQDYVDRNNRNHEAFFQALSTSKNGMSIIIDKLGKRLFGRAE